MLLRIRQKILNNKRRSIWLQASLYKWGPRFVTVDGHYANKKYFLKSWWRNAFLASMFLQWSTLQWLPCSACAHTKGLNLTIGWHHGWPPACVWALMCCWISRSWHLAHTWRACLVWVGEPDKYLAYLPGLGWGTWLIPGVPILSHPPSPHKPNPFIRNSFPVPQGRKNTDREQVELVSFLAKTNWTKKTENERQKTHNPNKRQISFCDLY